MNKIVFVFPMMIMTLSGCGSLTHHRSGPSYTSEEIYNFEHGIAPKVDEENGTVTYGLYPQTVVADQELIAQLNELGESSVNEYGWYSYNDNYYVKRKGYKENEYSYFPSTWDIDLVDGNEYWFKCEPIEWFILSNDNGEMLLLSKYILDAKAYCSCYDTRVEQDLDRPGEAAQVTDIHPNNYKYSDVRKWLIKDFYNSAFINGDSYVQTVEVDNSVATTAFEENDYVCENTNDKVFLLSAADYLNENYGFSKYWNSNHYSNTSSTRDRRAEKTDYTTAFGSLITSNSCTRSPSAYSIRWVKYMDEHGFIVNGYADAAGAEVDRATLDPTKYAFGVRPAIKIKLQ